MCICTFQYTILLYVPTMRYQLIDFLQILSKSTEKALTKDTAWVHCLGIIAMAADKQIVLQLV